MITHEPQVFYQHITPRAPILAIDYGRKKLGIAVSDPQWKIAVPLTTEAVLRNDHITTIKKYTNKYSTNSLVIGLPFNMDGSESEQTMSIKRFTDALHKKHPELVIFLQDERLTSKNAENLLRMGGMNRHSRQEVDDSVAASLILESALERASRH